MSSSDDDVPLGQRKSAAAPASSKDPAKAAPKAAVESSQPAPRARKAPIIEDSDDDDDGAPAQKPAAAKPKPKPKATAADTKPASDEKPPKSEAERALTKNESAVKREVEQEQRAQEQKHAHKQQAAGKHKAAPKPKGGKAAKDGKAANGVEKVKKEKKVYDLPGQTRDTPDETDSLRKFYSSLRTQLPDSLMARKWLCQHGLLPREEAEELVAELAKEKAAGKPRSPSKPRPKPAANGSAPRKKAPPKPNAEKPTAAKGQKRKVPPEERKRIGRPPHPVKRNRKIAKKDDAFSDGGLLPSPAAVKPPARPAVSVSDDDDVPLAARAAAKAQ